MLRAGAVELPAGGVPRFPQERVVVAVSYHPPTLWGLAGPVTQRFHDVVERPRVAAVHLFEVASVEDGMAVGLDETGQGDPLPEVYDLGTGAGVTTGLVGVPHVGDSAIAYDERIRPGVRGI